ncbi:hypothetical protein GCM10023322_66840 [Rugosimonospora acidiphila]|uniref:Uncharacterized protein n=1 Tax=Rugosimonospora acidiphila TaxID=556531 RepID=A0ABP9SLQ5_9ACTN
MVRSHNRLVANPCHSRRRMGGYGTGCEVLSGRAMAVTDFALRVAAPWNTLGARSVGLCDRG